MTTPALPAGYLTRMRSLTQAVKWDVTLGGIRQFRAYCCNIDSSAIMGVAKQPVVKLSLRPTTMCLDDLLTWDFTGSYAPSGFPIASYAIDMGDGTSYWAISGTHTYLAIGTYTIKATVTDSDGRYTTITRHVTVMDCSKPGFKYAYTSYDGGGVYFMDFGIAVPVWTARNTGLTGFALYVRDLGIRPHTGALPDRVHELWACTYGGVYRSFNGGRTWRKINMPDPSNAEFGDVLPAVVGELDWYNVCFDPLDKATVYILAVKTSASRVWVYKTDDLGVTWTSEGVVTP